MITRIIKLKDELHVTVIAWRLTLITLADLNYARYHERWNPTIVVAYNVHVHYCRELRTYMYM